MTQNDLRMRKEMPKDGNCFFHSVANQLQRLGLPSESHSKLRKGVTRFMLDNPVLQVIVFLDTIMTLTNIAINIAAMFIGDLLV